MNTLTKRKKLSPAQYIAVGFLLIILVGTLILCLPISSKTGQWTDLLTALFTATSATCVTGLVVVDTFSHWNVLGQLVILTLIQIGGLGFISLGVFFTTFTKKNISLRERGLVQESMNAIQIGGVVKLVKKTIFGTFLFEGIGALLLMLRFIPKMGWRGVYYGIFHSISAFCNAGFDLMGESEPYISLVEYADDWLVNITVVLLVVIGGLGFMVWQDLLEHKLHFKKYLLHTKIVVVATLSLLFGGAVLFLIFERNNLFAGIPLQHALLRSLFASMTPRTAGFNTIDVGAMTPASKLLTIVLMFIGGSPGSTAGGAKTTTVVVMFVAMFSYFRNNTGNNIFGRRLEDETVKKATSVVTFNMTLALLACILICGVQNLELSDVMIEVFSAINTVGMSAGITRELVPFSRVIIIILMYCGRIGSLTFAFLFMQRKAVAPVQQPVEKILIG